MSRSCKQKTAGNRTQNWPFVIIIHPPWVTASLLAGVLDLNLKSLSNLIFRAARLNRTTFGILSNLFSAVLVVPLCSATLQSVFLSAQWPPSLYVPLVFLFVFVWKWPSCGYYLTHEEYSWVGAHEDFVIRENRLRPKNQHISWEM